MSSDSEGEDGPGESHPSPTSDDGLPAKITHQPSNPSNPILRQPVGFQYNSPANTYHAPPSASPNQYLPGQAPPPVPQKPPRKSKSKPKDHDASEASSSKSKRKPRAPMNYIPWLPGDPPPFSATLAAAGTPGATTFVGDASLYMTTDRNKLPPHAERERERAMKNKDNFNYYQPIHKVYSPGGTRIMPYPESNGGNGPPGYTNGPSNAQQQPYEQDPYQDAHLSQSSSGSTHRKKHRSHRHRDRSDNHSNDREPHYATHGEYSDHHRQRPSHSIAPPPQNPYNGQPGASVPAPTRHLAQLRILTLLIEDLRRDDGERDQLAEIRVPLKNADNPEDGFWADAKEVCKELQSGPARIDGPAKAFTRRGKYRQYFLRVTAGGTDEYSSANLRVEKDRTLQVLVEGAPNVPDTASEHTVQTPRLMTPISVSGAVGSPRTLGSLKRKHEPQESFPYASPQSQYAQMSPAYSLNSLHPHSVPEEVPSPPKKRKKSPNNNGISLLEEQAPIDDWGELPISATAADTAGQSPQRAIPPTSPHHETQTPHTAAQPTPPPLNLDNIQSPKLDPQLDRNKGTPSYPGLITGSESHKHTKADAAVIRWLKSIITREPGWNEFVESRRTLMSVGQQMKHFRFVQNKCDQWVGMTTPEDLEDAPSEVITKVRVVGVFGLPLSWGDTCTETLTLTELYGPGGSRLEDERVVAMLDEPPAVSTGMQVKEYLKQLRLVDQQWDRDHGDGDGGG